MRRLAGGGWTYPGILASQGERAIRIERRALLASAIGRNVHWSNAPDELFGEVELK